MTIYNLLLQANMEQEIDDIRNLVQQTVENTSYSFWGDACVIAIVSCIVSFIGLYGLWREIRRNRIDEKCQLKLFNDLIRHLYRNKICTVAMRAKYNALIKSGGKGYPSEEHYRKQQLLPEDIHLERYNHNADIYDELHKLELRLRNYNSEIEVAERHMTDPAMDEKTKQRDFDTLEFKTGMLTSEIAEVLNLIDKERNGVETVRELISSCSERNQKHYPRELCKWGDEYKGELDSLRKNELTDDEYFTRIFTQESATVDNFKRIYTNDLLIECGENEKGEEKIHIIKL